MKVAAELCILLVEDNPGDAELVTEVVEAALPRASMEVATTLKRALEALRQPRDVVLLDLTLPDSDGVATVERVVGALGDRSRVPVVVSSGATHDDLALECVERGAEDFVPKNELTPERLGRAISFAMARKRRAV